jgi:predicted transcriptional regulator
MRPSPLGAIPVPRTIELDEEQGRELERLAARQRRSVEELVRQAVDGYLAEQRRDWSDWGDRFDALVARIQARIPPDVTPEEIEADITAARAEVRAARAARRAAGAGDAGSR